MQCLITQVAFENVQMASPMTQRQKTVQLVLILDVENEMMVLYINESRAKTMNNLLLGSPANAYQDMSMMELNVTNVVIDAKLVSPPMQASV